MMVVYHSPFHLIPELPENADVPPDFRMLLRQLLLKLELNGGTTMVINGQEYDRNRLRWVMEDLKDNFAHHLRVYRNPYLLQFLESGDLSFFKQPPSWLDLQYPDFAKWLRPYFTDQYAQLLYKAVSEKGFRSINKLRILSESKFKLPVTYRDPVNYRAFRYLQGLLREAEHKISLKPRRKAGKVRLDKNLKDYLTPHLLNVIRNLNDDFLTVKTGFADWTQNLLHFTFTEENEFKKFNRIDLELLEIAAQLNYAVTGDESINRLASHINQFLVYEAGESRKLPKWLRKILAFGLFFLSFSVIWFPRLLYKSTPQKALDQSFIDANAAARRKDAIKSYLVGDWETPLSQEDSLKYGHNFTFYKDGKGESSYYFPQKGNNGTCFLSVAFSWSVEVGYPERTDTLHLELSDIRYRMANCQGILASEPGLTLYRQLTTNSLSQNISVSFIFPELDPDSGNQVPIHSFLSPPHLWPKLAK